MQDAFVIAVEKQARERLERLSALKKIKPVDMTKLSQQVDFLNNFFLFLHFPVAINLRFKRKFRHPERRTYDESF